VKFRKKVRNGKISSKNGNLGILDHTHNFFGRFNEIGDKEENRQKQYFKTGWDVERDACGRLFDSGEDSELDPEVGEFFRMSKEGGWPNINSG
jgi:hypothetical protein